MKVCRCCAVEKEFAAFPLRDGKVDTRCLDCKAAYHLAWREKNRAKRAAYDKAWATANKERALATKRRWVEKNPEKSKECVAAGGRKWAKKNVHKINAKTSRRKALRLQATPAWADSKAIDQYYLIARFLTEELGTPFQVDHVVPLQSKQVCGLHVQTNLSILPAAWNAKKGNRTWPGKP